MDGYGSDWSVLEAVSWRLASELCRRHPTTTRLLRTHPGSGMYDCLTILGRHGPGTIHLNRVGTIQVHERFDGRESTWQPTEWEEYLRADPAQFLKALESAAGLPAPSSVPAATTTTLIQRVLADMAASAMKTVRSIEIRSSFIDSSGDGGGPNEDMRAFVSIPPHLRPDVDSLFAEADYRFWIVYRNGKPALALDTESGLAFTPHSPQGSVMEMYEGCRRNVLFTAAKLLRVVDEL